MESIKDLIEKGVLVSSKRGNNYHFDSHKVAEEMKNRHIIFHMGRMYKYTGTGYRELSKAELRSEVYRFGTLPRDPNVYIRCITTSKVNEIIKIWKDLWSAHPFRETKAAEDPRYKGYLVSFLNGLYNVTTDELLPHTPKVFVMERFDFEYDPTVTEDSIKNLYQGIIEGMDYDIFFTALGRTFFSRSTPTFAVVIHGGYGTGKSFLYHAVDALCVENANVYFMGCDIDLENTPAYLIDKVANMTCFTSFTGRGGDVNLNTLYKLVKGDQVLSHRKFESKESVRNSTPFWFKVEGTFSTEDLPTELACRTYCVNCRFEQKPMRPLYSLCDQYESYRSKQWVVNEALRMFRKYGLTPFDHVSKNSLDLYLEKIGDATDVMEHLDGRKVTEIYEEYLNDLRPGQSPLAKSQFLNHIKSQYGLGTRHKSIRIGDKVTSVNIFCKTD